MFKTRIVFGVLAASLIALCADDKPTDKAWNKPVPEWTADDAHQVMTDSPWVKTTTPTLERSAGAGQRGGSGGGRRSGGIGIGGVGIGIPGIGGGYPGGGNRGGSYPGRNPSPSDPGNDNGKTEYEQPPDLTLRWESALPVRAAELRERDVDAPMVDENHYAIAVMGVPRKMLKADTRAMEADIKNQAALKRDGKKDLKPSSVQILQRDDGPVIVFFFPRSTEILKSDRRVEFEAQIGRLKFAESFYIEDMMFDGKLAL